MKESVRSIAAFALTVALCVGIGEGVLRRAGIGPRGPEPSARDAVFDPVLGWMPAAGSTVISTEPGHAEMHYWEDGQRASWRVPDRPAARTVVLHNVPEEIPPFLRERGIPAIDCVNPDYETDAKWKLGGVGHPSALQHERWAECIGRALEADGIAAAGSST